MRRDNEVSVILMSVPDTIADTWPNTDNPDHAITAFVTMSLPPERPGFAC